MLNLVVKVAVERGEELFSITIPADIAGHFLEYLGSQLKEKGVASMPVKSTSPVRKAGEES